VPTPLGRLLSAFLSLFFSDYTDPAFTSRMEERLDDVSGGLMCLEAEWALLRRFFRVLFGRFWGISASFLGGRANP
jgi:DNA topoisomerase IA